MDFGKTSATELAVSISNGVSLLTEPEDQLLGLALEAELRIAGP